MKLADLLRRLPRPALPPSSAPALQALRAVWQRHWGRPAWLALGLLLIAALLQWQLRPQLQREQSRLETRRATFAALPRGTQAIDPNAPREPLQADLLPALRQRGQDLEWLVEAAQRSGLELDRADYALGAATNGPVTRVEASLPLTGPYRGLRQFVAELLNTLPHAALESLQVERANTQSPQLQATARLVLFYREDAP